MQAFYKTTFAAAAFLAASSSALADWDLMNHPAVAKLEKLGPPILPSAQDSTASTPQVAEMTLTDQYAADVIKCINTTLNLKDINVSQKAVAPLTVYVGQMPFADNRDDYIIWITEPHKAAKFGTVAIFHQYAERGLYSARTPALIAEGEAARPLVAGALACVRKTFPIGVTPPAP